MLTRRVIPCLDVANGRVVKGVNFVELRDAGDPVEQATIYDEQQADEICFLDISASPEGRSTMVDIVARTAEAVFTPLTVGGGVRSTEDMRRLLDAGADKVAVNTAAIRDPSLLSRAADLFGSQAIVVCVDAKRTPHKTHGFEIYSHGGRTPEGIDAIEWCERVAGLGAGEIMLTSMDRDGTGKGYDTELITKAAAAVPIPIIASGGVGQLAHLAQGLASGAAAVLAASIFHFGRHTIREAKDHLAQEGFAVRPLA